MTVSVETEMSVVDLTLVSYAFVPRWYPHSIMQAGTSKQRKKNAGLVILTMTTPTFLILTSEGCEVV